VAAVVRHAGSGRASKHVDLVARRLLGCLLVAVTVVASGCASRSKPSSPNAASPDSSVAGRDGGSQSTRALTGTVAALCQVKQDAARSLPVARATFYDRAHDGLHTLARALGSKDRVVAARLLEAKNAVEQDFADQGRSSQLQADLARLLNRARDGLDALSLTPPICASSGPGREASQ